MEESASSGPPQGGFAPRAGAFASAPTGHVFRAERKRGPVWYAKYRLPDGRQVQRKLGPAWSERGRPPAGYFTKRLAEDWLRDTLEQARRGTLHELVRTGVTVDEAADEYLRYIDHDRERKPSTVQSYRWLINAQIRPTFGAMRIEQVTERHVERWLASMQRKPSTRTKALVLLVGIFARAEKLHGLTRNPARGVERPRQTRVAPIEVLSPEEVRTLVAAAGSEQDGALFLAAAFTGLRMGELLALHWGDVDFDRSLVRVRANYAGGVMTTPKSGKVRVVPLAGEVSEALKRLAAHRADALADQLVFPGETGVLDGSALRRRFKATLERAGLRPLRFHDLRHTFGTRVISQADIRRVQEWMGHADIQTTMRYLHYAPRSDDALLVTRAFARES